MEEGKRERGGREGEGVEERREGVEGANKEEKKGEGRRRRGKRRRMEGEGGEEGEVYNENLHDKRLR